MDPTCAHVTLVCGRESTVLPPCVQADVTNHRVCAPLLERARVTLNTLGLIAALMCVIRYARTVVCVLTSISAIALRLDTMVIDVRLQSAAVVALMERALVQMCASAQLVGMVFLVKKQFVQIRVRIQEPANSQRCVSAHPTGSGRSASM